LNSLLIAIRDTSARTVEDASDTTIF